VVVVLKTAPDPNVRRMVATVAWLYHTRDRTQNEVAAELGLSRATVARMLKEAKERAAKKASARGPKRRPAAG